MKRITLVSIIILALSLSVSGCAYKWRAIEGVRTWTQPNYESLLNWQSKVCATGDMPDPNPEECAILKTNINPYMNILHEALSAIKAIEDGDDIKLARKIYNIGAIVNGIGGNFDGLLYALKTKDLEMINSELPRVQAFAITNAGITAPVEEKPGFIRRMFKAIW